MRNSLVMPRRACSKATFGGKSLTNPSIIVAIVRKNFISAAPRKSSGPDNGPKNPYDARMPKNVPTSASPTFSPISSTGPSIEPIVITIPSTAATMPKPGRPSAVFEQTPTRGAMLFFDHLQLRRHQQRKLLRLDGPFDDRREGPAHEFRHVMVGSDLRILREDLAFLAVGDVLFQDDQPFAVGEPNKSYSTLNISSYAPLS